MWLTRTERWRFHSSTPNVLGYDVASSSPLVDYIYHLLILYTITGVNTAVFDYCEEGTIDDMLEDEDQKFMSTWTPAHVLRYAWQVTKALADVHR
jgi:hypothetical protein